MSAKMTFIKRFVYLLIIQLVLLLNFIAFAGLAYKSAGEHPWDEVSLNQPSFFLLK